jgi:hypothetical protein
MIMHTIEIIMTILVGTIFAIFVSTCGASEWISYGVDATGNMQFDRDSVRWSSKDTVTVWTRVVYSEEGEKQYIANLQPDMIAKYRYDELRNADTLVEIDCHVKKARYLLMENYDEKGAPLYSGKFSLDLPSPWYYIEPGSVADKLCEIVCASSDITPSDDNKKDAGHEPHGSSGSGTNRDTWIRADD